MSASIGDELAARIATHPLGDEAGALVLAACEGEGALSDLLGGSEAGPSRQPTAPPPPVEAAVGVFLKSISVEGFRGIGSEKALTLQPGPGLTLVVGRNGSGKSSFAEALELLLTGTTHRWANRPIAWRKDWRNLHHLARTAIAADFTVASHGPTTVARQWPAGSEVVDGEATAQHKGEARGTFSRLGWSEGLALYRPFLSYNELGSILDEGPSKLFDAIARVLGVDDFVAVADRLDAAKKQVTDLERSVKATVGPIAERLRDHDDPRAAAALAAFAKRGGADLDAIETLLGGADQAGTTEDFTDLRRLSLLTGPDLAVVAHGAEELRQAGVAVASVTGTDAGAARELASLLQAAIAHHSAHGDGDCPVCGNVSALDATWRDQAEAQVLVLRATAKTAEDAHRRLGLAVRAAQALISAPPAVLGTGEARETWEAWAELGTSQLAPAVLADELEQRALALDATLAAVREEAAATLARREDLWRPLALELTAWLANARQVRKASQMSKPLKEAYNWVQEAAADARHERFAPIAGKAKTIWDLLRQQSNVELGEIVLAGTKTSRHVVLDVTVDGVSGAALGVMSQGELHALALSLFLPRATMDASPFRFVVIDDPVQSMDPARVDGLARVLEEVATTRQVVVFTHDDRLREAVCRLQVPARVLEVSRRMSSEVEIVSALDPAERALDDARALVRTRDLPKDLARSVVPTFCRQAIEARCADVVRRRRLERGESYASVEDDLAAADRLGARVALALFDDADRGHDQIGERLGNKFGARSREAFFRCNRGAHSRDDGDLDELVRDVEVLVRDLAGLT